MHVLFLFTYDMSLKKWKDGKLLSRELKIYQELADKYDIKFTFLTYGNESDYAIIENRNINVIPIYDSLKYSKNKFVRFMRSFKIPFYINKLDINPSLVKTNQLNGVWVAIIYKIITGKPIYIRTGYDLLQFKIKQKKFFQSFFFYFLTQFSLIYANVYSVTSNADKKFLSKFYLLNRNKVSLRPNWVIPPTHINPLQNRKKDSVFSVGRLEMQKNYISLIQSLSGSTIKLDIVGKGHQENELKKLAEISNLSCNFLGSIEFNKLMNLYSNYKIFVTTTLYEGNPKTILEAMASGCIVVAPNIPNINEIIESGVNGIIFDPKKDSLLEIVEGLFDNEDTMDFISNNAHNYIKNNYSLSKYIEDEFLEYKNLINN